MIKIICTFLLTLIFLGIATVYMLYLPINVEKLSYNQHSIAISRDEQGIPHIQAENRRSFLYAWGYVTSEDRLFQCSFRRLFAQGRLSEYLGERTLPADLMMRELGLAKLAKETAARLKKENPEDF